MFDYDKKTGEIWIYDEITASGIGGVSSGDVVGAIKAIGNKALTVRINSPGGDVFEGLGIYNALQEHGQTVTTQNDALAASIASVIMLAGTERKAAPNSFAMIHRPFSISWGTATDLRKTADLLDNAEETLVNIYTEKLGLKGSAVSAMLDDETWFNADDQIENLIATTTSRQQAIDAAAVPENRFKKTPAALVRNIKAGERTAFFPNRTKAEHRLKILQANRR